MAQNCKKIIIISTSEESNALSEAIRMRMANLVVVPSKKVQSELSRMGFISEYQEISSEAFDKLFKDNCG